MRQGAAHQTRLKAAMNLLLSQRNLPILLRWSLSNTLMAFDFDGTLAPIVDDPQDARLPIPTWQALDALCRVAPVAVVSGRSCASLQARLPPSVRWQVGNHGNEGLPGDDRAAAGRTRVCALWHRQIEESLSRTPRLQGIQLENKGSTLSVHYRHCVEPQETCGLLQHLLSRLQPRPRLLGGWMVFNLLPAGSLTKLEALHRLQAHARCDHLLFAGDDLTDELAFAQAPAHWLTIRVGMQTPTQARYRVRHPAEVCTLLQHVTQLRHRGQRRLARLQRRSADAGDGGGDGVLDPQARQPRRMGALDENNQVLSHGAPQVPVVGGVSATEQTADLHGPLGAVRDLELTNASIPKRM